MWWIQVGAMMMGLVIGQIPFNIGFFLISTYGQFWSWMWVNFVTHGLFGKRPLTFLFVIAWFLNVQCESIGITDFLKKFRDREVFSNAAWPNWFCSCLRWFFGVQIAYEKVFGNLWISSFLLWSSSHGKLLEDQLGEFRRRLLEASRRRQNTWPPSWPAVRLRLRYRGLRLKSW